MTDPNELERSPEKPVEDWTTGDEPMTGPQMSYLKTLSREAGVEFDEKLTKAEASKRIDELQAATGRGKSLADERAENRQSGAPSGLPNEQDAH
jgi:hypothetical protein